MGPFSHLTLARAVWPLLSKEAGLKPSKQVLGAYYNGSVALDAGYYPSSDPDLAELAHLARPWEFCRILLRHARNQTELAFALGWLTHAWLDMQGHSRLVNPLAGGAYPIGMLRHKQIEWGMDCWQLGRGQSAWLWKLRLDPRFGLNAWQRGLRDAYGLGLKADFLARNLASEQDEMVRLPIVWRWTGLVSRPRPGVPEIIGGSVGFILRQVYVGFLQATGWNLDHLAVLTPEDPSSNSLALWDEFMREAPRGLLEMLTYDRWPKGNLDLNPNCTKLSCPAAKKALARLKAKGGGAR